MMLSRCMVLSLLMIFTATIFVGCRRDSGPERVVVSGAITYRGRPVSVGSIRFVPEGVSLPSAAANIVEGKYRADNKGGVPVGTHKIQIEGYDRGGPKSAAGGPPVSKARGRQFVPSRYNTESQIQITIEPGSREITKNFDLTN